LESGAFDFGVLSPGFFGEVGDFAMSSNMGRVSGREKGHGVFRNPRARRPVALSAVVSTDRSLQSG
jgi:hypothetical protein